MQINYSIQTIQQKCKKKHSHFYAWIYMFVIQVIPLKFSIEEFPKGNPSFISYK